MKDYLATYLRSIDKHALLTRTEEGELARLAQNGDAQARNKLIVANLRLAVYYARHYYRCGGLPLEDLIQEANLGLFEAVERFNPDRGVRFSTYATWHIRRTILFAIRQKTHLIRLPLYLVEAVAKTACLQHHLGRTPTKKDIIAALPSITPRRAKIVLQAWKNKRLFTRPQQDEKLLQLSSMMSNEDGLVREGVHQALQQLTVRERDILTRRFGLATNEPQTLSAIGKDYSRSRERIRQIIEEALAKLRKICDGA